MNNINKREILKQSIFLEVSDGYERDHSVDKEVQTIILEIIDSKENFLDLAKDDLTVINATLKNFFEGLFGSYHEDYVWILFKFYFLNGIKIRDAKFDYKEIIELTSKELARVVDTYYKLITNYKISPEDKQTLEEELKKEVDFETRETIAKFTKKEQYKPHLNFTKVHRNRLLEEYKDDINKLKNIEESINNLKTRDKYWEEQLYEERDYVGTDIYLAELELMRRLKFYDDMLVLIGNSKNPDKSVLVKMYEGKDIYPWKKKVLYAKEIKRKLKSEN